MSASLEDIKTIDIEEWLTLNTASSPTKLNQGQTPNAKNVYVDEKPGSVVTSKGFVKVGTIPSNLPPSLCVNFFRTSSGAQVFVVSDNATVWTTLDFQTFTSIITGLSSSFQLRGMVIRDKLWLTNGSDSVRVFDGTTVTVLNGTGGTPDVPKGRYIGFHDERVWMYHLPTDRSAVRFTALVDSSGAIITPDDADAWPTDNQIQISEGDSDFGTGLILYRGYLYAFKQYSIYRIIGYDEYTYSRVKTRASTGSRFAESLQIKDNLVHLVGVDGIYVFDGEDAVRISDIIDPDSADQVAFGFDDIQQPNTNDQFFQTADTADWNAGTISSNLSVDDSIYINAADSSQSDFQNGVTQTNLDLTTTPGAILLTNGTTGVSSENIALNKLANLTILGSGVSASIGSASFVTDGNLTNQFGFSGSGGRVRIVFDSTRSIIRLVLKSFKVNAGYFITFRNNANADGTGGTSLTPISVSSPFTMDVFGNTNSPVISTPTDITITFNATSSGSILFSGTPSSGPSAIMTMTEMQVYAPAFQSTGTFVSDALDLKEAPASLGFFNAGLTLNGQSTPTFFTQSSADGVTWDASVACTNGGAVGSTRRRYLRWGANLTSNGLTSPRIDDAYLVGQYISSIHNTGGSIFAWGPFEADYSPAGQTVNFYYRAAATSGAVLVASWSSIVPGGVISASTSNQYIQFKIEILSADLTHIPVIRSVTINWVSGTGTQPSTFQNVASAVWRNRYWLSVASSGATENDTILVRGKKTADFDSPWQLKDWNILSFVRFHGDFYGGSSLDGSIYKLDTGYSKDGEAMDAYFETQDFVYGGFYIQLSEVLVEVERLGPYELQVGVSADQGATWTELPVDLTESTYAPTYMKRLNFGISSDRLRFRVRTNAADQPFQVHRLIAFYSLSKARGSVR